MRGLSSVRLDIWIFGLTLTLIGISILMVFSTTAISSQTTYGISTAFLQKHLLQILLGFVALVILSRLSPEVLNKISSYLLFAGLLMLALVLVPGVGVSAGGARRWIGLGGFRIQPGELVKVFTVLYMASYIGRHHHRMLGFVAGAVKPLMVVGITAALLLSQPDFGSTMIILAVVFLQLLTVSRLSHLVGIGVAAAGAAAVLILSSPYRLRRVEAFLDPLKEANSSGYQLVQSLIAIGSGGVTGEGLGAGKQKLFYLPAAHTDFIFSVIAEELGLLGALFVLSVFVAFAVCGVLIAKRLLRDPFLCSLAVGLTSLIVVPALLNMGVVLGLLPTKGLVLPLVAYGGTAMVVNLAVVGMLLRLARVEEP